ncbi:hypothetical protein BU14_0222s0011 [Porphyra umbilicalis]|uniref:Uncharacterized protein n=1 Tax=Porphyra umbilicalis TaxID=2786 RepID=A0A1X6P4S7_PORUM|nr:hypothetical protein BU14_0222s0011 [Porphyra umbilicalis]|eukprot:OSX75766.1 hypothetical protein BU14_0222s0011 [Porphyra umbilicalis]
MTAFVAAAALPGRAPTRLGSVSSLRPSGVAVRRSRRCRTSSLRMAEEGVKAESETETAAEAPEGLVRPEKKGKVGGKKSLLKPDGTPYAPWMGGLVEEPSEFKAKAPKTDAKGRLANDPQAGELAGVGLKGRILGDEVDLRWDTGTEVNNLGFKVMRRAGKSDKWEFVADYQTAPSELQSKGSEGGSYTFIDSSNPPPGTWIYRVSDVSKEKKVNDLAQCMVDVEDSNDRSTQKVALAVLVVLGVVCVLLGVALDPQ